MPSNSRTDTTHPNRDAFPKGLSGPARRALDRAGVRRVVDLSAWSRQELGALHGMGPKALTSLDAALAAMHRRFRDD